jgi:hypothetical protein
MSGNMGFQGGPMAGPLSAFWKMSPRRELECVGQEQARILSSRGVS